MSMSVYRLYHKYRVCMRGEVCAKHDGTVSDEHKQGLAGRPVSHTTIKVSGHQSLFYGFN
jgi:hypothetical protein